VVSRAGTRRTGVKTVKVDQALADASPHDYDALVLPAA